MALVRVCHRAAYRRASSTSSSGAKIAYTPWDGIAPERSIASRGSFASSGTTNFGRAQSRARMRSIVRYQTALVADDRALFQFVRESFETRGQHRVKVEVDQFAIVPVHGDDTTPSAIGQCRP